MAALSTGSRPASAHASDSSRRSVSGVSLGAGLRTLATGAAAIAAALWQILDLRAELDRSADECAASHPELARRLRRVARQGWAE